jgi:hypothetical protein
MMLEGRNKRLLGAGVVPSGADLLDNDSAATIKLNEYINEKVCFLCLCFFFGMLQCLGRPLRDNSSDWWQWLHWFPRCG